MSSWPFTPCNFAPIAETYCTKKKIRSRNSRHCLQNLPLPGCFAIDDSNYLIV
ncbi:hypothetical protein MA16_Dca004608 [Dendrobium catenatum]|uniref:Uncharacterized protein n=1 Tax=Dendrobium catenatum TaxID=906689 RepID=A0A2I0VNL8_9ASPA|nr:hypothetical protein MA16_Dca004608 [Dendrobium catenatum]